jgi:carboxymethylenebutenolidase
MIMQFDGVGSLTYNADHGFQCDERDSFAAEAAQFAWGRTLRFIDRLM